MTGTGQTSTRETFFTAKTKEALLTRISVRITAGLLGLCFFIIPASAESPKSVLHQYMSAAVQIAAPSLELSKAQQRRAIAQFQLMWPGRPPVMDDYWFVKENAGDPYEITSVTLSGDHAEILVLFQRDPSRMAASEPAPMVSTAGQYTLAQKESGWIITAFREIEPSDTDSPPTVEVATGSSASGSAPPVDYELYINDTFAYVENLQTCSPSTYSYPYPLVPGFTGKNVINGLDGGFCLIEMFMPNDLVMKCRASPRTVELMQNETKRMLKGLQESGKYHIATKIDLDSGMTSSDLTNAMSKECKWQEG